MDEDRLFADVEELLKLSENFRERIEFAGTSWTTETDALRLFESQVKVCETIQNLVKEDRYAEALILNRTVFENYFLISLILKGAKYVLKYKVPIDRPEKTAKEAYDRVAKELEKQCAEGRRDIISFRPLKGYTQIEIVHRGLYTKKGERLIPIYYFVFEEYDPVRHRVDKIKSIVSKDFFPDIIGKWQKKHEALYKTYLGFGNLLEAALLNGIIADEQRTRVVVHYNFLSAFTHLTKKCFDLMKNNGTNHYLIELSLLYVLRILRLYLLLLIEFFWKTEHKISNAAQLLSYLDDIGKRYDYFWFIFNTPSEYDFWRYQTTKRYRLLKGELLDEKVPYYKDPYERLKRQHQSAIELTTGLTYTSPWPRNDVVP